MARDDMKGTDDQVIVPLTAQALGGLEDKLVYESDCSGKAGRYQMYSVADHVLKGTSVYQLVVARHPAGRLGLAMIATQKPQNARVYKQARILQTLESVATDVDQQLKFSRVRTADYASFFPSVLETLVAEDGRMGVFFGYHPSISSYGQLTPLTIATKDVRVDLRTGAWVLGKTMKLLQFIHNCGFTVGLMGGSNILIETALHGVFVLDFTTAEEQPSSRDQRDEVAEAARAVWVACGGSSTTLPPYDANIMRYQDHQKFLELLVRIMLGQLNANQVYEAAYGLFKNIWPLKKKPDAYAAVTGHNWHEYVTYPR